MKMKPADEKKDHKVTIRAAHRDEEGHKRVEKVELNTRSVDTLKYVERKLVDKGVQRMERHPADGLPFGKPPPKGGHGGKYTWEGPAEGELNPAPPAIDEGDPNYVVAAAEEEEIDGVVVGEVEVAKAAEAREGVARIEIDPLIEGLINSDRNRNS
ncbi:uncharacterized protein LOC127791173 [Diospyros lotus]|uniref:uncharacterized protein LOC127791173 n=1 Tax=Diospyros lotus TaxID=55363 RepID=UPI00225AD3C1|nr:uncharacterized protein LOC127791173 [Diospyros lotus]